MSKSNPGHVEHPAPTLATLERIAGEFIAAAEIYEVAHGSHNAQLAHECRRAAAQLRTVATFIARDVYTEVQGYLWIRASWRVLTAIGRTRA